jgi:LacI family transcriptional regulator
MKPKLSDIAKLAGVGHATVDRVLNERGGVKPRTAKRVLDAAKHLGFDTGLPTLYQKGLRFEVLLGRKQIPLCARLNNAFRNLGRPFGNTVAVERTFLDESKPEKFAEAILKTRGNAVIIYGQDHELIVEAIAEVTSAGKPVVTIVSDVPTAPRLSYVGIDHYKAGRCAAFFLSKMAPGGNIVILCSSSNYHSDAERVSGCRDGLAEYSDSHLVSALIEFYDNDLSASTQLIEALIAGGVTGIYNAGADIPALERHIASYRHGKPPVLVGHDLTLDTERMLQSGAMAVVIDQNPDLQVRKALYVLGMRFGLTDANAESPVVPFTVHVRDNI